jgi:oxygen-independent coproporphyrinogen-3 oxidase
MVVYAHIPYCFSKCPYCDFASVPADNSIDAYLDALGKEARNKCSCAAAPSTLYVGGGTPTILSAHQLSSLFRQLRTTFQIPSSAEITIEANPRTLSPDKVEALFAAGVNRMSVGGQSFVDSELRALGRTHQSGDIESAISLARRAGISNISLDLMFGIPGQTAETWRYSLRQALSLAPEHISAYCLTLEPGTPLHSLHQAGAFQKKSEDEELELYEAAHETLTSAGYEHYEISNYAIPGKRSKHNLVYWLNEEYLGLGASAVSYLGGRRIHNVREPSGYIDAMNAREDATEEIDEIPLRMQAIETMIQRLRLTDGIDCSSFSERFGVNPTHLFGDSFAELAKEGLLEVRNGALYSTSRGWRLANEVALRLLP